ncbi:teichuronic acid biosynthesis protein TuaE [Paenibacillus sp. V4I3]|uniref:O-antigen ligase family protein n=1 Tax=Paenibacillus sp. V4I3 TaxID=3042305 RepID=UPI0027883D84|nr:O-antigen ligase family protein [Paenibacillus sp. V4I3]MDQ0873210.1 teichuronic acid biosynthesis protein TuaE [Paenibacillus sp. V4I3]
MDRKLVLNNGMTYALLPVLILIGLVLGIAVLYQPILVVIGVFGAILIILSFTHPDRISSLIILSTASSIQFFIHLSLGGLDILSFYKFVIVLLIMPSIIYYGIKLKFTYPIIALLLLVVITYFGSDWHMNLTRSAPIKAFIGLAIPFVFLLVRWKPIAAERHIRVICFIPLISMIIGVFLHFAGIQPLYLVEFTGAFRMQGASIPPHLAMLAYLGVLIALIEVKRNPKHAMFFYVMVLLNFAILLSTGTRGPLIASTALLLYYLYDQIKEYFNGKLIRIIPLGGFLVLTVISSILMWANVKKRSFERTDETGIDLSGRSEAWDFFLKGVENSPWFGRGLGSSIVANDGSIYAGFVVPHNEYIRFYFDTGIIGAVILFLSLFMIFYRVYRVLDVGIKPYYIGFIIGFLVYSFSDNTLSTLQFTLPFCWYLGALHTVSLSKFAKKEVI